MSNIPKLRFKEFNKEWEEKTYGDIYSFYTTNSLSRDKLNYENGQVYNIHYGDIHKRFSTMFKLENEFVPYVNNDIDLSKVKDENYCQVGDLVIADASEDYNDIGKTIEIISLNDKKTIAGLHTFLARPNKYDMAFGYVGHILKSWNIRKQVMTIAQGTKVLSLSIGRLSKIKLNIPIKQEQEKIASFLTAVDTKIEQLNEKIELLEEYKKGIIQKIFSQEIRFKDNDKNNFENWEIIKLEDIGIIITGKTPSTNDNNLWNGDISFITPTDIKENIKYQLSTERTVIKQTKMRVLDIGTIVYTCIASIGKMSITTSPSITNQQINSIIVDSKYNNEFIYYALLQLTPYIKSLQANTTLPIINKTEFSKFKIDIPSVEEQTKIVKFLSSIDEKIVLVQEQLNQTKEFKKALLQQMFI